MKTRTLFAGLFLCLFASTTHAQQQLGLHFMDVWQSSQTNPAMLMNIEGKGFFSPASTYANFSNSAFNSKELIVKDGNNIFLDVDNTLPLLDDVNQLTMNASVETLAWGLKLKKGLRVAFSHAVRSHAIVTYPKELLELAWEGNGNYIGETMEIGPSFDMTAYQEYAVAASYPFSNKLAVGVKAKYLIGLTDLSTSSNRLSVHTDNDIYQINLESDYTINSSGFPILEEVGFVYGDDAITSDYEFEYFPKNRGYSFDLGVIYRHNDKWTINASVLDVMGTIKWTENTTKTTSQGSFTYEGLDASELIFGGDSTSFQEVLDTIAQRFEFEGTASGSYRTKLPMKTYISTTYKVGKGTDVGALMYGQFYRGKFTPAFALSVRQKLGKVFSIGTSYSVGNNSFDNLGLSFALKLGAFQLFGVSDNVVPLFRPLAVRNTNVRIGMNFNL